MVNHLRNIKRLELILYVIQLSLLFKFRMLKLDSGKKPIPRVKDIQIKTVEVFSITSDEKDPRNWLCVAWRHASRLVTSRRMSERRRISNEGFG